jgi:predicted nucleic acid-binding protein
MRGDKAFLDTNVLIYAFAKDDPPTNTAETLLATGGGVVGVLTPNWFVAVAVRKLATLETHDTAMQFSAP